MTRIKNDIKKGGSDLTPKVGGKRRKKGQEKKRESRYQRFHQIAGKIDIGELKGEGRTEEAERTIFSSRNQVRKVVESLNREKGTGKLQKQWEGINRRKAIKERTGNHDERHIFFKVGIEAGRLRVGVGKKRGETKSQEYWRSI